MSLVPWRSTSTPVFSRTRLSDEMNAFQREVNNLMNSFMSRSDVGAPVLFESSVGPSIDLKEKDNKYLLDADVPGMSESDLDINFKNNTLTIKGEKKSEVEEKNADYVYVERSFGSFRRDIPFNDEIDQDGIKANLKDGVLHVELAKKEKGKSSAKKISIFH